MATPSSLRRHGMSTALVLACAGLLGPVLTAHAQNAPLTGAAAGPAPASGALAQSPASADPDPAVTPAPQRPVVRQRAAPAAEPAQTAQATPAGQPGEPASRQLGGVTRLLLAAQADGRRGGPALPMLGVAADRAWQRYIDSFSQPIPQWFDERVRIED